ncbi:MAG: DUF4912 domain-containing protein, partial [Candidatus Omnitrophica bacterium]|nr:DUF4912 domain-containing protein [Candidatus Omnitrophota bacterium]
AKKEKVVDPIALHHMGAQEYEIEKSKYTPVSIKKTSRRIPEELPAGYGKDKIVLSTRDPWWLYTYWEITHDTWNKLRDRLKDIFYNAKRILRIYDVSHINFNGSNAHKFFDITINHDSSNWYIDSGVPGRSWCVDYGLKLHNGDFITIVRSNIAHTPLDGPSWVTDEEWMIPDEMFGRLYGMGFGLGRSSPVGKAWQERIKQALFSGALASPGISSAGSPVKKAPKQRKFWMVVDCELIVYGATEPDASVSVQGKPIKLRPDGTFTLRFALPDGKQVIPVKAVSFDEIEERTITPIVSRETKSSQLIK